MLSVVFVSDQPVRRGLQESLEIEKVVEVETRGPRVKAADIDLHSPFRHQLVRICAALEAVRSKTDRANANDFVISIRLSWLILAHRLLVHMRRPLPLKTWLSWLCWLNMDYSILDGQLVGE